MSLAAGTRLGAYEIVSPLGAGAMGEVYRARDIRLDREVAIKVLPAHIAADPERFQRFDREAKTTAALNHPNIVTIFAIEQSNGMLCIAMELVDGRTLSDVVPNEGLPLDRFFDLAIPLVDALSAAHEKGITHRDLKPANVMVTADGRVKVLDFGLAKLEEIAGGREDAVAGLPTVALTGQGQILGTVAYMSPEQAQGKPIDPRSDLFSVGIILHEMLTGERPFKGDNSVSVLSSILKDTPPSVTDLRRGIPPELGRVIQRCLEKEAGQRTRTARELRNQLLQVKDDLAARQTIERRRPASGRRSMWFPAASIGFLLCAVALASLRGWLPGVGPASPAPVDSVAVLPFVNTSGNPDSEYLSDGITDSVINSLARIGRLRVVPRGVSFSYKGKTTDPAAIAKALNVRAIVTGRVAQRGDTLVVGAELMDVATLSQAWGDQYTRKAADIFALQDDVARDIAKGLRLKLVGDDESRLTKRATTDTEAYRLFLRGDFAWDRSTPAGWTSAIGFYEQAIDRDPNFAAPYVGIASSYLFLAVFGAAPPGEAFQKARGAVLSALRIDDASAKGHDIVGTIKWLYDWDDAGAEREFQRGHALDANVDDFAYGSFLSSKGRDAEAIAEMERAIAVNPGKVTTHVFYARILADAGRLDDALREGLKYGDSGGAFGQLGIADTFLRLNRLAEAETWYRRAAGAGWPTPGLVALLVRTGRRADAERLYRDSMALAAKGRVLPLDLAEMSAALGRRDDAFGWLDRALDARAATLKTVRQLFLLDSLRDDRRWADLERRIATAGPPP